MYFASCSFGKDSIATILLAIENGDPLDRVVYSEVMFDKSRGISAEYPDHARFIHEVAIPKIESMGVRVDVVRSDKDFLDCFHQVKIKGPRIGKVQGFPIGGMCTINRDCKVKAIHDYYKQFKGEEIIQYIGIAKDEPIRLRRLKGNQISILDKYGYTEAMAFDKCKEYGLLSPIYGKSTRGGCWFCPNAKIESFANLKTEYPELWESLLRLGKTPNLCSYGFKYGKTIEQVDALVDAKINQLKIF